MAEIIRPTQRRRSASIVVKEVKPIIPPNLPRMSVPQFREEAVRILEDRLLFLGIIIPKSKIKRLAPALIDIGKKYYELAEQKVEF